MSLEKYSARPVQDRIITAIETLVAVKRQVEKLVNTIEPPVGGAEGEEWKMAIAALVLQEIDEALIASENSVQAVRNAVITLAKAVAGEAIEDGGEMEVDVVPDENGLRF